MYSFDIFWFFLLCGVSFAIMIGAAAAFWYLNRELHASSCRRRQDLFEVELADQRDLYGALMDSHKRLRSRIAMRDKRSRERGDSGSDSGTLSDAEWKRQTNMQLHRNNLEK
jgi:hypothetical protein